MTKIIFLHGAHLIKGQNVCINDLLNNGHCQKLLSVEKTYFFAFFIKILGPYFYFKNGKTSESPGEKIKELYESKQSGHLLQLTYTERRSRTA